jgi:lysophospholipase L1-like esterase
MIGINDVWRQFDTPAMPDRAVSPAQYEQNVEEMILSLQGRVKGVFLMTPYYMEPNPADTMRARMDEYGAVCQRLAEKHGCALNDLHAVSLDVPYELRAKDGFHYATEGYANYFAPKVAAEIKRALGL